MVLVATIISYLLHSWFLFVFYYHCVCFVVIAMRSKWHKTQLCLGQNSEFMAMMLMSMTKNDNKMSTFIVLQPQHTCIFRSCPSGFITNIKIYYSAIVEGVPLPGDGRRCRTSPDPRPASLLGPVVLAGGPVVLVWTETSPQQTQFDLTSGQTVLPQQTAASTDG